MASFPVWSPGRWPTGAGTYDILGGYSPQPRPPFLSRSMLGGRVTEFLFPRQMNPRPTAGSSIGAAPGGTDPKWQTLGRRRRQARTRVKRGRGRREISYMFRILMILSYNELLLVVWTIQRARGIPNCPLAKGV